MNRSLFLFFVLSFVTYCAYSQDLKRGNDTLIINIGEFKKDTIVVPQKIDGEKVVIITKYQTDTFNIKSRNTVQTFDQLAEDVQQANTFKPKYWSFNFEGGLTGIQSYFMNWTAGGDNAVSGRAHIFTAGKFKKKGNIINYSLRMALGYQWFAKYRNTEDIALRKTDDKLEFDFTYGYKAKRNFYYTFFTNFRTQFANGYDDTYTKFVSKFMAPGYLFYGIGMEYQVKDWIVINLSPITVKHTFILDSLISSLGNYGVEAGHRVRTDLGANLTFTFNRELLKNVFARAKFSFFMDYLNNPQNIDVNLEMGFSFKINKFFSTNISVNYIYDDQVVFTRRDGSVGPGPQLKETFGIGLVYRYK